MAVRHPEISEVRGPSLMIGIEFGERRREDTAFAARVLRRCLGLRLVLYPAGPADSMIRFIPPLNVNEADLDEEGLATLDAAIAQARSG